MGEKRISWLDYARCAAIFCVVLCHAAETYYRPVIYGQAAAGTYSWYFLNTLFMIGRLGVPIFLALTGILMLGRNLEVRSFYRRSLLPLFLTTEIWIAGCFFFNTWYRGLTIHWGSLVRQMLLLETGSLGHLWYMPMILSIYLVLPFLSGIVLHTQKVEEYRAWFVLGLLMISAVPTANALLQQLFPNMTRPQVRWEISAWGGLYVLYIFAGWCIGKQKIFQKISIVWIVALGLGAFVCNTIGQRYLYLKEAYETNTLLTYSSTGIFVSGLCLVEILRRLFQNKEKSGWFVATMAHTSFGIYFLHKPLQMLLSRYVVDRWFPDWRLTNNVAFRTLFLFLTSLLISYGVVLLVTLLSPQLGHLVFGTRPLRRRKKE